MIKCMLPIALKIKFQFLTLAYITASGPIYLSDHICVLSCTLHHSGPSFSPSLRPSPFQFRKTEHLVPLQRLFLLSFSCLTIILQSVSLRSSPNHPVQPVLPITLYLSNLVIPLWYFLI